MTITQQSERHGRAAAELRDRCPKLSSEQVVESLSSGLTHLRDLLMVRAHDDVERECGEDSMIMASLASMQRRARNAKIEIEAYSCIVVDDEVTEAGYVGKADPWFLPWLCHLRLGEGYQTVLDKRVELYRSPTIEDRRLKFLSVMQKVLEESAKAPLVLFRLYPRSVRIAAAVAFGDAQRAQALRDEQIHLLPAISECHECHGRVLDNFEVCRCCGNPVWNYTWLRSD